ncbi:MAG TPA: sigma-70 family RNA polymerase sigma factor [Terriglobales bacterium]|nr:sigma-70 family RNA polymerase sigma factor [Terriglobales bacterium]
MKEPSLPSSSFEELALPLLDRLFNFACWLTQDRDQAEDLLQESLSKALKGFSTFQPGTNFRAWIYRIVRNTFFTSRTGLKTAATQPLEEAEAELLATASTPESILLHRLDQQSLWAALEQLPLPFREILLLREVEEMSYQEISSTLALPMGTVMSRLARARKALRQRLEMEERSQYGLPSGR